MDSFIPIAGRKITVSIFMFVHTKDLLTKLYIDIVLNGFYHGCRNNATSILVVYLSLVFDFRVPNIILTLY